MSLFQCEVCGVCENTALSAQGFKMMKHLFDWSYAPEREGLRICSACGPTKYRDGKATKFGKWHNQFKQSFYPMGEFFTDDVGDMRHKTLDLRYAEFAREFPERMAEAAAIQAAR